MIGLLCEAVRGAVSLVVARAGWMKEQQFVR